MPLLILLAGAHPQARGDAREAARDLSRAVKSACVPNRAPHDKTPGRTELTWGFDTSEGPKLEKGYRSVASITAFIE